MNRKIAVIATSVLIIFVILASGCITNSVNVAPEPKPSGPASYLLPTEDGQVVPSTLHSSRKPSGIGEVIIEGGIGSFEFNTAEIETIRPDIFQPGHFSLFDILVHLDKRGDINLVYHFDETMNTHVIDSINGESGWWYYAFYSGGWRERNVFRMDMYPYKDNTTFHLYREDETRLEAVYNSFAEELTRSELNNDLMVIPEVTISSPAFSETFNDVVVTAHNVRRDVLQPGVVTALDILLSLLEQGELSQLKLTWYESIGTADVVDSYWTEKINEAEAYSTYISCGFVYETGPLAFEGFIGSHIHIPSDIRVIVSPEYALWFWICL